MVRAPGLSVRLRLTLSYAAIVVVTGMLVIGTAWLFVLRYLDDDIAFRTTGLLYSKDDPLRGFAYPAALLLVVLVIVGVAGGWVLAGRMLAPLTRIAEAARVASTGALAHRVALAGRQDEFRELADAFDAMLAQLEDHVTEQQRFAANASHELRTPLAITQTLLDVARNDPGRPPDELVERLHVVNARAIELTEALLLLSRAGQRPFELEPVDVSLLAEEAVETLLPLAEQRGVDVDINADPALANGSPPLLLQLTTNLVHNAIAHNVPAGSADSGAVWVRTATDDAEVVLTVENTGAELTPTLVSTLVEPFQRGSERIRTDDHGVGLGLAIVQRIAAAHSGSLRLVPRSGGGLAVTVRLPAAPPSA